MLNRRSAIVAVGYPNSITYAVQSINNSISRKRDWCRQFIMHGRRHRFRIDRGTHVLNTSKKCEAFVLCGCAETNNPPQRCWIGGQVDRSILLCCAGAGHGVIASPPWCNALWKQPTRKYRVVCRDAPASSHSRS
ncbi:hypothetical protein TcG_11754 [Trypanosoma cruzi]|nr:hypothetical protein TcG_11754 [Trypanosoma cruzi]